LGYNTNIWKCENETLFIPILNKNAFFSAMENRKVKEIPSEGWYHWEGIEYKQRVLKGEYGRNTMYSCKKMEK
jgi:hypothetical protein